jgi:hypothetical protein
MLPKTSERRNEQKWPIFWQPARQAKAVVRALKCAPSETRNFAGGGSGNMKRFH